MKKMLLLLLILLTVNFSNAVADDDLNYIWGIPLGITLEDAASRFQEITGYELQPYYKNKEKSPYFFVSNNITIRGNLFSVTFSNESETRTTDAYGNFLFDRLYISRDYSFTRSKIDFDEGCAITNSLFLMLTNSFCSPSNSFMVLKLDNNTFPRFDAPYSDDGLDIDLIKSLDGLQIIAFYWKNISLSISFYSYDKYGVTIQISEGTEIHPIAPTLGTYSPDKIGIQSF